MQALRAKMRGIMSRIYKVGILHERVTKNPVLAVETRCKTTYRAIVLTPTQTFNILKSLTNPLHHTLVLTCAATALRSSEILALRWEDILWLEEQIRVSKRWIKGMDGETKTEASDGHVPLRPVLANHLRWWRNQTPTGRIGILSFLPSRLKVAFLSPLPYLSLTISVRLLKQPGYKSMMVRGSGFITFVTR